MLNVLSDFFSSVPQVKVLHNFVYKNVNKHQVVKTLWYYLHSNAGSWERTPGVKMLWHGVNEENDPTITQAAIPAPPALPTVLAPLPTLLPLPPTIEKGCAGVATNRYLSRPNLASLVEKEFCPTAVKQGALDPGSGSLARLYNLGTMEEVTIAMEWAPGLKFQPNTKDCLEYLLSNLVDGCDGNDPKNAEGSKAGGSMTVGEVKYRIDPQGLRQPWDWHPWAGCDSDLKALLNDNVVWGRGFATADFGESLKEAAKKRCALLPDTWHFSYGLGNDGREWTAKFRTGIFQNKCMGHLVSDISGTSVDCQGKG